MHNEFDWICANGDLLPLLRCVFSHFFGEGKLQLGIVGCGSSRIDELLEVSPEVELCGLDIDEAVVQEARARWEGLRQQNCGRRIDWSVCDLAEEACIGVEKKDCKTFDVVLDKGTLDYLICEEVGRCYCYLRNMHRMCRRGVQGSEGAEGAEKTGGVYVLISFRAPEMLISCVEAAAFVLRAKIPVKRLSEDASISELNLALSSSTKGRPFEAVSSNREDVVSPAGAAMCYIFEPLDASASENEGGVEAIRKALDRNYREKTPLRQGEIEDSDSSSEPMSLHDAYLFGIPENLRSEYDFPLFLQDLNATCPQQVQQGKITKVEVVRFIEENQ